MIRVLLVSSLLVASVTASIADDTTSTSRPPPPNYKTYIGTAPAAPTAPYNPTLGRPAVSGSDHDESKCNAGVCPK
jgi:hypothetical protein